jgi:hypothetical protein
MQKKSDAAWAACLSGIASEPPLPKALVVTIVSGQNFPKMDKYGSCDPLIQFRPDDGQKITKLSKHGSFSSEIAQRISHNPENKSLITSVAKQTMFPRWDETFLVSFQDDENPGKLELVAWDHDNLTDMDFIGEVKILCETLELWMKEDVGFMVPMVCELRKGGLLVKGGGDDMEATIHLNFKVEVDEQKHQNHMVSSQKQLTILWFLLHDLAFFRSRLRRRKPMHRVRSIQIATRCWCKELF